MTYYWCKLLFYFLITPMTRSQEVIHAMRSRLWEYHTLPEIVLQWVELWYVSSEDWEKTVSRRLDELVIDGTLVLQKETPDGIMYSLTELGKTCNIEEIHSTARFYVWKTKITSCKRKKKSDKIRTSREESIIKSENKVLNERIETNCYPLRKKSIWENIKDYFWF